MKTVIDNLIIPEGNLPSELPILKYGKTDTTEGPYFLDEKGADSVLKIFSKRNIDLYFDYEHKSLDPETPEQGKAAGWFELEKREDGIWAKNIKWTEQASEYLRKREYRYFSPVLKTDKNGNVFRLINIALTNLPATDNIEPLIELKDKKLSEQIDADTINGEMMKEHLDRIDSVLDHAMGLGHLVNKHMMEMLDEDMKSHFDKVHEQVLKVIDGLKEKRKEFDPHGMYTEKMYTENDKRLSEKVEEVTGSKEYDKQIGILLALKDSKESVIRLNEVISSKDEEIKLLSEKLSLREKEDMVDKAISGPQKKLLLKQRSWALSLNKEQLQAYLEVSPTLNLSEKIIDKPVELEKEVVLHENELKFLSLLEKDGVKISAADLIKAKKDKGLV